MEIHSRQHPARGNRHRRAREGDAQCARTGGAGCHAFVARGWIEGHAHAHAELCHARERSADRPVGGPLNTESPRPSIETAAGVSPADLPRRYIWNRVKAPQHVHGLACRVTTATTRI